MRGQRHEPGGTAGSGVAAAPGTWQARRREDAGHGCVDPPHLRRRPGGTSAIFSPSRRPAAQGPPSSRPGVGRRPTAQAQAGRVGHGALPVAPPGAIQLQPRATAPVPRERPSGAPPGRGSRRGDTCQVVLGMVCCSRLVSVRVNARPRCQIAPVVLVTDSPPSGLGATGRGLLLETRGPPPAPCGSVTLRYVGAPASAPSANSSRKPMRWGPAAVTRVSRVAGHTRDPATCSPSLAGGLGFRLL